MKKMILVLSVVLGVLMMGCSTDGGGGGNGGGGSEPQQVNIRVTGVPETWPDGNAFNFLNLDVDRDTGAPLPSFSEVQVSRPDNVASFNLDFPTSVALPGNFTIRVQTGGGTHFTLDNHQLVAGDNPDIVWPVN